MEMFFTGKTVEAATEAALTQLGIAREEISVEVVELPVKRLFRSTPAKIRVTLLAEEEEAARRAETAAKKPQADKKTERQEARQSKKAEGQKQDKDKKPEQKTDAPKKEKQPKKQPEVEKAPAQAANGQPEETEKQPAEKAPVRPVDPEKAAQARTFLQTVAADMGVTGFTISEEQQDETLVLKVSGEGLGLLIGRRGETMEALSYLVSLVANRSGGDYQKVALDVAGYRSKRESDLVALARRMGAKVAKSGRSYTMEPMNPYERRIIHATISKMEGVTSASTGEGEDRRVVISSTDPAAVQSQPQRSGRGGRGGSRSGRGGRGNGGNGGGRGGGQRREAARTEYKERSREQTDAPVAGERTETVNDAPGVSLYGKIEL